MYPNAIICTHLGLCWMQLVGRVYTNCIICKHLGQVGVTKEHIMCANAIICTLLWGVGAHHVPKCYYLHAFRGVARGGGHWTSREERSKERRATARDTPRTTTCGCGSRSPPTPR